MRARLILAAFGIAAALGAAGPLRADDISIVGSSTVYPFMRLVADEFSKTSAAAITIEATGTETGFDYFCAGMADFLPDMNNASFAITRQQRRTCNRNGVRDIVAFLIGYDGLVVFTDAASPLTDIGRLDLYRAIAAETPAAGALRPNDVSVWAGVNDALPGLPIRVLGPPQTSGTRLYIEDGLLKPSCYELLGRLGRDVPRETELRCMKVRGDGAYVDVSEDDQFLIGAVGGAPGAIGLVGYGQFQLAGPAVKALTVDGVAPNFANIETQRYPLSRPLFVYVKRARLMRNPDMAAFLRLLLSDEVSGRGGALSRLGLVPPSDEITAQNRRTLDEGLEFECPSVFCAETAGN